MSSSKAFRADSVYFLHQSNHDTQDVAFHTSNSFDIRKPIKCQEYIINDKYKIIESDNKLVMQQKVGDTYQTKVIFD